MVRLYPVVPAQKPTMPPRFTTKQETGKVASPGCSNTQSTFTPLPVVSQIALPKPRTSFAQASCSGVPTFGICPQHLKLLRLITPLAPSDMTYSRFSSSETTPMALAPAVAHSCPAIEPRPPDAPHTSTLWPG